MGSGNTRDTKWCRTLHSDTGWISDRQGWQWPCGPSLNGKTDTSLKQVAREAISARGGAATPRMPISTLGG